MTFDFGTFVVGLFSLVLAALENYFFYRPPSAATSLLLRREATAAAVAAWPQKSVKKQSVDELRPWKMTCRK